MTNTLISTKLFVPTPRPNLVQRPHLAKRLTQGLDLGHSLTLISAPAGYGKTTLLSEWLASRPGRIAWLSLDEQDSSAPNLYIDRITAI